MMNTQIKPVALSFEKSIERLLLIAAAIAAISVVLISIFIFSSGMPVITKYGLSEFLLNTEWKPVSGSYGILPLIAGTMAVTVGALILGIFTGLGCAVALAELLPKRIAAAFKFAIELLAGIPSVVYGFFGLVVVVPAIRSIFGGVFKTTGFSVLAGAIVLGVMILPTIISLSENAISSVKSEYREASLALGAGRRDTILKVVLPAARSGILASIILGMGRAIGETMAVLLITGNVAKVPGSIFDPAATLTGTIAMEMGYAGAEHKQALFAVGIVLFFIILILNLIAQFTAGRMGKNA